MQRVDGQQVSVLLISDTMIMTVSPCGEHARRQNLQNSSTCCCWQLTSAAGGLLRPAEELIKLLLLLLLQLLASDCSMSAMLSTMTPALARV
jgi:hypothetical protein